MTNRVTIRQVAEKAGVSIATVSRAMNQGTVCSEATRQKVLCAVNELGYMPDRFVGALSRYRSRRQDGQMIISVVWLIDSRTHCLDPLAEAVFRICKEQGEECGVQLSKVSSHDHGGPSRCSEVLFNRGVDGVILTNILSEEILSEFTWSHFSVVSFLQENYFVPFDLVREHYFRSFFDTWHIGFKRGHRRIGAVLPSSHNSRQNDTLASVSDHFHAQIPEAVPDLIQVPAADGSRHHYEKEVVEWFEQYRPTLVIGKNEGVYHFLKSYGFRCPQDFQFVAVRRGFAFSEISGFDLDYSLLAECLLEKITNKILKRRRGSTGHPIITLIPSQWNEGETLTEGPL